MFEIIHSEHTARVTRLMKWAPYLYLKTYMSPLSIPWVKQS